VIGCAAGAIGIARTAGSDDIVGSPLAGEGRRPVVSQTLMQSTHLPTSLRALRVGLDDDVHIRRTVHLAAAKIEDLQEQVARLVTALESGRRRGGAVAKRAFSRRPG
jgi:hypothetical protein